MMRARSMSCELPSAVGPDGERRGRWWLIASFVFCPCHLPLTLGILAALGGAGALGGFVRGNGLVIGVAVSLLWVAGTGRGLLLIRQADRAAKTALALAPASGVSTADGPTDAASQTDPPRQRVS